jgi:hypothetical protein
MGNQKTGTIPTVFKRFLFSYIFFLADLMYDQIITNQNEKQGAMNGQ